METPPGKNHCFWNVVLYFTFLLLSMNKAESLVNQGLVLKLVPKARICWIQNDHEFP